MPNVPPKPAPEYPAPGYMTVKQYADHAGVSRTSIQIKIDKGKLNGCCYKDSLNRWNLDPDKCDAALAVKTSRELNNQKTAREGVNNSEDFEAGVAANQAFNRAKSANEVIKLQKAQIELKQLQGSLVSMDQVKKDQFLLARLLRDQLMSFPDRISALLTSMNDERKINQLLKDEIRSALKSVIDLAPEEIKNA